MANQNLKKNKFKNFVKSIVAIFAGIIFGWYLSNPNILSFSNYLYINFPIFMPIIGVTVVLLVFVFSKTKLFKISFLIPFIVVWCFGFWIIYSFGYAS